MTSTGISNYVYVTGVLPEDTKIGDRQCPCGRVYRPELVISGYGFSMWIKEVDPRGHRVQVTGYEPWIRETTVLHVDKTNMWGRDSSGRAWYCDVS